MQTSPAACPHGPHLLESSFLSDPYSFLQQARSEAPVYRAEGTDLWVVTRHEDVRAALADPATFSSANVQTPMYPLGEAARQVLVEGGFKPGFSVTAADPPLHTMKRRFLVKALEFTPRRVAAQKAAIHAAAHDLIDGFAASGAADLVRAFTSIFPAHVVYHLIGFPPEDRDKLLGWSMNRLSMFWGNPDEAGQIEAARGMVAYWNYCVAHVEAAAENPGEDITGNFIRLHRAEPENLSLHDIQGMIYGLIIAGQETTANLIAGTLLELLRQPGRAAEVAADPALLPAVLEEGLRFTTPITAWRRITTRPVTLGGIDLPEGAQLLLHIGSANRDGAVFPEGDRFDPSRAGLERHIAFGQGAHFCVGAVLARLEGSIGLTAILERLEGLRLAPGYRARYLPIVAFRTLANLEVAWDADRGMPA